MLKIAVNGAKGKMGQMVIQAISEDPKAVLIAKFVRDSVEMSAQLTGMSVYPIDILIDFSTPEGTMTALTLCTERKIGMVIGTTGFDKTEIQAIEQSAKSIPIVLAPNMSQGVNITYELLQNVAKLLKNLNTHAHAHTHAGNWVDIGILDIHHQHKKDAPSGTALQMAKVMNDINPDLNQITSITSQRIGDLPGAHKITFSLPGEMLEISHTAFNRLPFAKGAVEAAHWLYTKKPGLYSMAEVYST